MTRRQDPSPAPELPAAAANPEFAPVPRKFRHDGWTPERQKAFILRQAQDDRMLRDLRSS